MFQKVYDEIKYLCKVATAGSKEARQLEKVKKTFEQIYRESTPAEKNTTDESGVRYSISVLDDGNTYVTASRKIISGNDKAVWRKQISSFFNTLLENNKSLEITATNGDVLTITKNETAYKARDNYKQKNGKVIKMTDEEFKVKLNVEAHIDEIAEISFPQKSKSQDTKNHNFAKDGFSYRTAYFEDFDKQYYKITLSIGHNGNIATVYNVGKINKDNIPSATKLVAVVGSKPLGTLSKSIISNSGGNVNTDSSSNTNSLSDENDIPIKHGNYNVMGEDIMLEAGQEAKSNDNSNDIAPVRQDVVKNDTTEDIAPDKKHKKKTTEIPTTKQERQKQYISEYAKNKQKQYISELNDFVKDKDEEEIYLSFLDMKENYEESYRAIE